MQPTKTAVSPGTNPVQFSDADLDIAAPPKPYLKPESSTYGSAYSLSDVQQQGILPEETPDDPGSVCPEHHHTPTDLLQL